jgi:formylmethanofuran dehydrogenase subunit E
MLNITMKVFDIREVERIYVTCEIPSCISDSFQILAGATIENNELKARVLGT